MTTSSNSTSDGAQNRMRVYAFGVGIVMALLLVFYVESMDQTSTASPTNAIQDAADSSQSTDTVIKKTNVTHATNSSNDIAPQSAPIVPTNHSQPAPHMPNSMLTPEVKHSDELIANNSSSNETIPPSTSIGANKTVPGSDSLATNTSQLEQSTLNAKRSAIHQTQIDNFRNGQGLLLNIHFTHHAGTFMCGQFKPHFAAPPFACMDIRAGDTNRNFTNTSVTRFHQTIVPGSWRSMPPWNQSQTDDNIRIAQEEFGFRFISQEYGYNTRTSPLYLAATDWEHPQLVSTMVVRHPIERMLAGDAFMNRLFGGIEENRTHATWWKLALHDGDHANLVDNFNLFLLTNETGCCSGNATDPIHLESAKKLLSRFTYILDQACLTQSVEIMGEELGVASITANSRKRKGHDHKSLKERIPYQDVYDYLMDRNKLDIELYEWAKTQSLVQCDH